MQIDNKWMKDEEDEFVYKIGVYKKPLGDKPKRDAVLEVLDQIDLVITEIIKDVNREPQMTATMKFDAIAQHYTIFSTEFIRNKKYVAEYGGGYVSFSIDDHCEVVLSKDNTVTDIVIRIAEYMDTRYTPFNKVGANDVFGDDRYMTVDEMRLKYEKETEFYCEQVKDRWVENIASHYGFGGVGAFKDSDLETGNPYSNFIDIHSSAVHSTNCNNEGDNNNER